ncbi:uncharacterized protein LOC122253915 [Penaeus japonicus]|uniref:uncharacterized protein LOC122253915 n=1 Tax=Penaeus japonicus TaxID=27405 RepID=UPI001C7128EE|nr:uncharacterized protein LOC122253915 [Penaeus japonicus]XP_042873277.1 uncharacterized protein LOC122253915 [Penaeus japonicus]
MKLSFTLVALLAVAVATAADDGARISGLHNYARNLFGTVRTTTYTVVSASSSTVFYSCLSGSYTALICQGRKKKSLRKIEEVDGLEDMPLDASSDASVEPLLEKDVDSKDTQKIGFTVWTTSKTTTTVTVLYTNTASTIRISYYCGAGGINYPTNSC